MELNDEFLLGGSQHKITRLHVTNRIVPSWARDSPTACNPHGQGLSLS